MPGGPHTEELAIGGQFSRHAQTTDIRDMNAHEVDQPPGNERNIFCLIDIKLTHGNRNRGLLPQEGEVPVVLGSERILEEKEVVLLQFLGQIDRLDRRNALVNIVKKLDFVSELHAEMLE